MPGPNFELENLKSHAITRLSADREINVSMCSKLQTYSKVIKMARDGRRESALVWTQDLDPLDGF